ncbi:hypothetical protein [Roseomonas sp. HF4]|uniref:hypothetical protein n=1 Tax=Roseomonas sp. HF4 TaxID=2562313 RepID=UPI0010BFAC53|nr:hypothetical protein [Roseomonas sp. HF4]
MSSFTNADGAPIPVTDDQSVFTVCSRDDVWHGGHSCCYLEWVENKLAVMDFYDLVTPGHGRVQLRQMGIQRFKKRKVKYDEVDDELRHIATTKHHSYAINTDQTIRMMQAFQRFEGKVADGRYVYSFPGGKLGRALGALKGQRGVNCADLILKILNEAGIANVSDNFVNTPRYASGSSNR